MWEEETGSNGEESADKGGAGGVGAGVKTWLMPIWRRKESGREKRKDGPTGQEWGGGGVGGWGWGWGGFGHSPLGWFGEDAAAHYMPCLCSVDERCTISQLASYKDAAESDAVPPSACCGAVRLLLHRWKRDNTRRHSLTTAPPRCR